jgi:hypothetical protein
MDSGLAAEPVIGPATSGRTRWRRPGMTNTSILHSHQIKPLRRRDLAAAGAVAG